MELETYKTKQKDPVNRWKEQIRFEKIVTQIIVKDKLKKSNTIQKRPNNKKPEKTTKKTKEF